MRDLYDAGLDILGAIRGIAAKTVSTTPTKQSQAAARTTSASVRTTARVASQTPPPSPGISSFITKGATETPPPRLSSFVTQALADRTRPAPPHLNIAITRGATTAAPGSVGDKAAKAASTAMKSVAAQGKSTGQRLIALGRKFKRKRPALSAKLTSKGQQLVQGSTKIKGFLPTAALAEVDDLSALTSMVDTLKAVADAGTILASSSADGTAYVGNNPQTVSDGIDYLTAFMTSAVSMPSTMMTGITPIQTPFQNTNPLLFDPTGGYGYGSGYGTSIPQSIDTQPIVSAINAGNALIDSYNSALDNAYAPQQFNTIVQQAQAWMQQLPALAQSMVQARQQQMMQSGSFDPGTAGGGGGGGDYGDDPFADSESGGAASGDSYDDWPEGDAAMAEEGYAEQGAQEQADPFDDQGEAGATDEYAEVDSEELTPEDDAYWADTGADEEGLLDSDLDQSEDVYPDDVMGLDFKWQYILAPWMASEDKNAEDDRKKANRQAQASAAEAAAVQAQAKHDADVAAAAASVIAPSARTSKRVGRAKQAVAAARARQAQYEAWRAQEIMNDNVNTEEE